MKIRLVCATRFSEEAFFKTSALGRSFRLFKPSMEELEIFVFSNNTRGLSEIYNEAIEHAVSDPAILIFVHDDVYLIDFYWHMRLLNALKSFDIVGAAGNTRRIPKQANWYFLTESQEREDFKYLSGVIGHGKGFSMDKLSVYGAAGQECKIIDGLFIAVNSETLIKHNLYFDPQFKFHFYDLDFCRQAELKGLKMGTWQISLIHESVGNFDETWHQGYKLYLNKWGK